MDNDRLFLLDKQIEELFGKEPLESVEDELFRWFLFAYNKGNGIRSLNRLEFDLFKEKFAILIELIYLKCQGLDAE